MQLGAFIPQGKSFMLAVTSTSTVTPLVATPLATGLQPTQILAYNAGPDDAYLAWGISTVTAVIPTAGSPQQGMMIPAGAIFVLTTAPGVYYAAISAATKTASLYLTPGEGT